MQKQLFVNPPKYCYDSSQLHKLEHEGTERILVPPLSRCARSPFRLHSHARRVPPMWAYHSGGIA